MNGRPPLLVIAAGGTGGHMFPAQALAEAMLRKGWRVRLSTDERGARFTGGFPHTVEIEKVRSATFSRGGTFARIMAPLQIAAGVFAAWGTMRRDRPQVVVGFGGYPTIPALAAAWLARTPRMIHEQNGILGRVNRLFARRVDLVACGTWPTELPKGVKGVPTGNPVRAAVQKLAGAEYLPPVENPISILVIGGSQGARILSDVVPAAIARLPGTLPRQVSVAHQAREEDRASVADFYARAEIDAEVQPFFHDVAERLRRAQLVVSRAGASTVAEVAAIGRPAILIPYAAAAADHQTANARGLAEAGGAVAIAEQELSSQRLSEEMAAILQNPDRATEMAEAARGVGRPDATEALVALVEKLADKAARTR